MPLIKVRIAASSRKWAESGGGCIYFRKNIYLDQAANAMRKQGKSFDAVLDNDATPVH
jgi:hypothetical protein